MYDCEVLSVLYSFDLPRDYSCWQMGVSLFGKLDDIYFKVEIVLAPKLVSNKEWIGKDEMWIVYYRWSLDVVFDEFSSKIGSGCVAG